MHESTITTERVRPRVALWCDLGLAIGAGHVMRCYALGQALERAGVTPVFACDPSPIPWVETLLSTRERIDPTIADWSLFDAVVIDSYLVSPEAVDACRRQGPAVVVIADDATGRLPADLYVEPGINLEWAPPTGFDDVTRIAGPKAVLLRDEIASAPGWVAKESERPVPPHILILFGGVDRPQYLAMVLSALEQTQLPSNVTVITSRPVEFQTHGGLQLQWREPSAGIASHMTQCDFLISAAGVSSWEALRLGIPLGLLRTFANQEPNYSFMEGQSLAVMLGRLDDGAPVDPVGLRSLLADKALRRRLSARGQQTVDGRGADRVAAALLREMSRRNPPPEAGTQT